MCNSKACKIFKSGVTLLVHCRVLYTLKRIIVNGHLTIIWSLKSFSIYSISNIHTLSRLSYTYLLFLIFITLLLNLQLLPKVRDFIGAVNSFETYYISLRKSIWFHCQDINTVKLFVFMHFLIICLYFRLFPILFRKIIYPLYIE